jgi:hypothetical protein
VGNVCGCRRLPAALEVVEGGELMEGDAVVVPDLQQSLEEVLADGIRRLEDKSTWKVGHATGAGSVCPMQLARSGENGRVVRLCNLEVRGAGRVVRLCNLEVRGSGRAVGLS